MGIVNTLKILSQSCGPWVTGALAGSGRFWVAFVVAGALKASYDVLLLSMFGGRVHGRRADDGAEASTQVSGADREVQRDANGHDNERST